MSGTPTPESTEGRALDPLPIPVLFTDSAFAVTSANRAALALLGDEIVGRPLVDWVDPADHVPAAALRAGRSARATLRLRTRDGVTACELRVHARRDGTRLVSVVDPAPSAAGREDDGALPDPHLVVDGSTLALVEGNRSAALLFGRAPAGWPLTDAVPPDHRPALREQLRAGVRGPVVFDLLVQQARGEQVPVEVLAVRVAQAGPVRWRLALRDLRPRAAARVAQERALAASGERRASEATARLAGGLARELTGLLRAAERALSGEDPAELRDAVDSGAELLRALEQLSTTAPAREATFDLRDVVRSAAASVTHPNGRVGVEAALGAEPVPVRGDATALHAALVGLARHLLDLLPADGSVALAMWRVRQSFWVEVRGSTGAEVTLEAEPLLAPRFASGRTAADALAAPIAQAVARAHQLTLTAAGGPRPGFTLRGAVAEVRHDPTKRLELLLVDDDPVVRRSLARMVGRHHEVRQVSDGLQALAAVDAGPVDVVVCDVHLPGGSGIEIARAIRRRRPEALIVLVSGYVDGDELAAALTTADALLEKPFSYETFAEVIADRRARRSSGAG